MHTLGKVFAGLIILAAMGALVLSVKLLDVRNSWAQHIEENDDGHTSLKEENTKNAVEIAELSQKLREVRLELNRTLLVWGRYWTPVPTRMLGPDTLEILVGTNHGLVVAQGTEQEQAERMPVVYAFPVTGEGSSVYAGEFQVPPRALFEDKAVLKANWRIPGDDAQKFQSDQWRFWSEIPSAYKGQLQQVRTDLAIADELLAAKQTYLQNQTRLVSSADEHRNYRLTELLGDPDNPLEESDTFLPGYEYKFLVLGEIDLLYRIDRDLQGVWSIFPGYPFVIMQSLGLRWSL